LIALTTFRPQKRRLLYAIAARHGIGLTAQKELYAQMLCNSGETWDRAYCIDTIIGPEGLLVAYSAILGLLGSIVRNTH
jgi:hypothetical protein